MFCRQAKGKVMVVVVGVVMVLLTNLSSELIVEGLKTDPAPTSEGDFYDY